MSIEQEAKYLIKRMQGRMQGKQFVHFLHIGKTGGTAVKHAVMKHCSAAIRPYFIFLHPHRVRLRDIPKGESVIFFLRDPISRFVSGFHSRKRQGQPKYFIPWSPEEKLAFEHFSTPDRLAIALSSADPEEKARAQLAMKSIVHVRSSYLEWFESEDYFMSRLPDVFFVGFQEHLTEDFGILKSKLGLPDSLELPKDDIQAHRNSTDLDRKLGSEAIANLKDWYQEDFRFLELCKRFVLEHQVLGSSMEDARQGGN